jgi:hypothetical protein
MVNRLNELESYKILDSGEDQEFNELVQIACALFDCSVGFVSFMDDKRQWFKASKNLDFQDVPLEATVCKYLLDKPNEVFVRTHFSEKDIQELRLDPKADYGINFYAGAPIVSPNGNVLGSICVLDYDEKKFTEDKVEVLRILASRVMRSLLKRKQLLQQEEQIEYNAARLKKLTDLVPGVIFKLASSLVFHPEMIFINEGISRLIPQVTPEEVKRNPQALFQYIDETYRMPVQESFHDSYFSLSPIDMEFKTSAASGKIRWLWLTANPEKKDALNVVWYGTIQDISHKKGYEAALEKMLFDISHVIRRPLANIMGLVEVLKGKDCSEDTSDEMLQYIQDSVMELEGQIQSLNREYAQLKNSLKESD